MCRVVCPKPRRVAPLNLNTVSMAPSRFHIRNDVESNGGADLLGLILGQDQYEAALASSPPFSLGSPPCRTQNPLVHDADFGVEKLTFINETSTDSSSHQFSQAGENLGKKQAGALRVEKLPCYWSPLHRRRI